MKQSCLLALIFFKALCFAQSAESLSLKYEGQSFQILDQQMLPSQEVWIDVKDPDHLVAIIRSLKVRGAPMIGIAAAFCVAQLSEKGASTEELIQACHLLAKARPTAVNLSIYMQRMIEALSQSEDAKIAATSCAFAIYNEDFLLCENIAQNGCSLIHDEEKILTICNTGSLATAGLGTALGVIKQAHRVGKKIHVYVCETRPLLQGARLTCWELEKEGIPYTLICDSMAAFLMKQHLVDRVLVGADRIAINGDFANKIGTYSLAVLAHHHQVPFHVVAPYTTIDMACDNGSAIIIEERSPMEVRGACGSFGTAYWSPSSAPVYNPAFDVTPWSLVTSYILDSGVFTQEQLIYHLTSKGS